VYLLGSYKTSGTGLDLDRTPGAASDYPVRSLTPARPGDLPMRPPRFRHRRGGRCQTLLVSQVTPADGDTVGVAYPWSCSSPLGVNREEVTKKLR